LFLGQKDNVYIQKQKEILHLAEFHLVNYPYIKIDKAAWEHDLAYSFTKAEVLSVDLSKLKTCFEHMWMQAEKMRKGDELFEPFSEAIRASKNDEEFSENLKRLKAFEEKHGEFKFIPIIEWNTMAGQSCKQWIELTEQLEARKSQEKKQD
jgi:hypothetical protein